MNYLLRAIGVLVLVAVGLRLAAWLVMPAVPVVLALLVTLAVLSALLLPNFWARRGP
ncbi:MAG: hypothetical protein U0U69_05605 [Acidimicrobiia bacterium]